MKANEDNFVDLIKYRREEGLVYEIGRASCRERVCLYV